MSPLFSLYANDWEMDFLNDRKTPLELQELSLVLVLYANDMVIQSQSASTYSQC